MARTPALTGDQTDLTGDIVKRLRVHWPQSDLSWEIVDGTKGAPLFIRARVTPTVHLEATPTEVTWTTHPLIEVDGVVSPVPESEPYTIGVTTEHGAEAIADRFYLEVLFWWGKLHQLPGTAEQPPATTE